jgi:hypothetical protein
VPEFTFFELIMFKLVTEAQNPPLVDPGPADPQSEPMPGSQVTLLHRNIAGGALDRQV